MIANTRVFNNQLKGERVLSKRLSCLAAVLCLLLSAGLALSASAKVSGKISGVVEDKLTGDPLVGATVRVLGTDLVTQTDEDGEYYIIGVPVGKYDLAVTHVGFETVTKKEVRVLLDLTTPVDFTVTQATSELDEEMVVYASAPLIQKDLTASRVIFTEERLRNLPNITTVQAILTNYPGGGHRSRPEPSRARRAIRSGQLLLRRLLGAGSVYPRRGDQDHAERPGGVVANVRRFHGRVR